MTHVDEAAVRAAVERAYLKHAEKDMNRFELFGYATGVPDDAPDELALGIVDDVLADPPKPDTDENDTDLSDNSTKGENRAVSENDTPVSTNDFAGHFDRVADVYDTLGELDDGSMCIGNTDFVGWYKTRATDDETDGRARPWALGREFPGMRDDLERVVYATISYAPKKWYLNAWEPYNWGDDGREWLADSSPTPDYGEITAYAPFADVDLTDEVKEQRPAGDIPRDRVEDALARYIDAFADLAGDREHVFALDSVGGAYVMVAPTSTTPIAERYAPDGRRRLFDDLTDRMNDWLDDVRADVNAAVDVAGTFEPDLLNNKNRLYKAPMSVHSSLDGVVTPVDVDAPTYEYTPLNTAGDAEREAAVDWADGFTADHSEAIESVVASLWPDYYADADGWGDALDDRLNDLRSDEREHKRDQERLDDIDVADDLERTDDIDKIRAAIEDINVADLARKVSASWDTAPGRTPKRFEPSWRSSSSGTSCYADREKFVDLKEGKKGGGAVKLVARDRGIITDCRRSAPSGEDFWKAVAALREEGYDIPRFTGGRGVHPDSIGLYESAGSDDEKRRKALRVLKASKKD